jgi:lipopolysaccharide transport system permease protein
LTENRKHITIKPISAWSPIDWKELWRFRELAIALAAREVLVRYKQTLLGAGWAVVQPLVTMLIFTVLLTVLLGRRNLPSPAGIPYELSTYCALLPWQLFSQSVTRASLSILNNQSLVTKVYFPRIFIPMAPVLAAVIDFGVAALLFVGMMVMWGVTPGYALILLPAVALLALIAAFAVSLWLSALAVVFRDVQHIVPFLLQIMLYVSPILYNTDSVLKGIPEGLRWIFWLNPMTGVAEGFRWSLLDVTPQNPAYFFYSIATTVILLITGLYNFNRVERRFADFV